MQPDSGLHGLWVFSGNAIYPGYTPPCRPRPAQCFASVNQVKNKNMVGTYWNPLRVIWVTLVQLRGNVKFCNLVSTLLITQVYSGQKKSPRISPRASLVYGLLCNLFSSDCFFVMIVNYKLHITNFNHFLNLIVCIFICVC